MNRKRDEAYGNIYHIIHWGRQDIFQDPNDKLKFLECIGGAREKYDFFLLGYCIMDDHYHMLIKTHNITISKIMQSINTGFGKYYSKNYNERPFRKRYKSVLIKDSDISQLLNIIHKKPIYYNIVETMGEYPYISHAFYLMNVDSIVDIDYLLNRISGDRMTAIEEYSKIMDLTPENYEELLNSYSKEKVGKNEKSKDLYDILKDICPNLNDFDLIKKGSKKSYLMDYKRRFIHRAKSLGYSTKDIGEFINISDRAVRKHIHH